MAAEDQAPHWGVIGDVDCWTRLLRVSPLRKTRRQGNNNVSKLSLDVTADVTVVPLPDHLMDEEDLEDHYQVMMMDDNDVGQTAVEFASKLEIDLCLDEQDTSKVMETLTHELSTLIKVHPGSEELSLAAATILRDAGAAARDKSLKSGEDWGTTTNNNGNDNAVRVHLKASIIVEVVAEAADDDVEPAFVPASKSSIEKLERVRVGASFVDSCSICNEEIAVGSEAVQMPCIHFYHEKCIVRWLQTSRDCPLCRSSVPTTD